jgi:hypothetical protein
VSACFQLSFCQLAGFRSEKRQRLFESSIMLVELEDVEVL